MFTFEVCTPYNTCIMLSNFPILNHITLNKSRRFVKIYNAQSQIYLSARRPALRHSFDNVYLQISDMLLKKLIVRLFFRRFICKNHNVESQCQNFRDQLSHVVNILPRWNTLIVFSVAWFDQL